MVRILTGIIGVCLILLFGAIVIINFSFSAPTAYFFVYKNILLGILICVVVGLALLLGQMLPLIKKIVSSENKLLKINRILEESENRFRSAFDHAAIGMALVSLQGNYLRVNHALCQILGYNENEILQLKHIAIIFPEDAVIHDQYFQDMLQGKIRKYQLVQRCLHKNGSIIWMAVNSALICDDRKQPLYFITQLQNITAEKTAEEKLLHLAYHDALTGLYNRNKLEQHMQEVLLNASRHNTGFAVIFLDLDRFKFINDTIGHDAGDLLLQVVASRLKKNVRNTDLTARVGGDEFVIVLTKINKVDFVANIVQKILTGLEQSILINNTELFVTTSAGISVFPYDGTDIRTLIKNADLALYRAKELGRNNYQFCTPEMTAKAQQKMARQNALMNAFVKKEFELYYQPYMDLAKQKINGLEALLRWQNAEFKNINANEIIQLAEESGLIISLNEWVLQTACEQAKKWHELGYTDLTVSVNISPRQFKQVMFVETLLKILKHSKLSPEFLELEVTESLIMQDPEYILQVLHELKLHKIRIAIDDFGTGYSSLDYLRRFAIDKIKIDRTFTQRISTDLTSCTVVTAIIAMANKLGIKTIAEGVETREQYDFLMAEKCSEVQGYFLCAPNNAETITAFLAQPSTQFSR